MGKILDTINKPSDLKRLDLDELELLTKELRETIIKTVASSGGHLASSLGAVELITGLHYCLNAPYDKIVWDVGHQAYAHKLLTGRKDRFNTIRKLNGLSGFPNRFESEYDPFTTGHGSTSISTALGMVIARELDKKESYRVVAVIGDASLGGGMAFEALNHAGHLSKKLLVILNDNEMSISKSVGALSRYLNRIITAPTYNKIRKDIESLLKRVPAFGFRVIRAARRLEEGLKNLLVPGMLFEEMGFRYFGPIDGNDVKAVVGILKNIIDLNEPVFLHLVTKKGKGYSYAEEIPEKFHGVGEFDIETGEKKPTEEKKIEVETSFTLTFRNVIVDTAITNEKLVAITAAMPEGTGLDRFLKTFPERCFDVGMAEQHAVGFAAGLATSGLKPVVCIYSTFLQRSYDQILHDVSLQDLNIIFMLDRAGLVGEDGPTHHGVFDIAYLRHVPNMTILAPRDEEELKEMFRYSVAHDKGSIAIRYPRGKSYPLNEKIKSRLLKKDRDLIRSGKGEVLKEGRDITILAVGYMSHLALEAADLLNDEGIDCEVINARFIKPLDLELILGSVSKTKKLITLEEGIVNGGFGSAVLEAILEKSPKGLYIENLGLPDTFIEHGDRKLLLDRYGLSSKRIVEKIKTIFNK
ncbi:MAG: 1-deoxy-D-xylulose-5-phosphate synthase [Candidatus Omnitrophota bacterium]